MKKFVLLLTAFIYVSVAIAQNVKVYPTNWWVGMKHNKVQLLLRGDSTLGAHIPTIKYAGVQLTSYNKLDNGKYLAVNVTIAPNAKPGNVPIELKRGSNTQTIHWPLLARRKGKGSSFAQGVTSSDFIYLIMPDRFSNGDTSNDRIAGMRDQSLNRDTVFNRHGGDLKGIQNNLSYLQAMGVTSLWLNPVLENDMPDRTEHGYAFTDHYTIDPRLGGDKAYQALIDAIHARGMKIIQDAVYNHVGSYHWFFLDKPTKDWFHEWPTYTNTTYKEQPLFDAYAAQKDYKQMADGWFTTQMPDLNQSNPYVANFLIQHALWTVEKFGIDGWRIDTYAYNDLKFMNRCNKALLDEYPTLSIFGETWVHGVINQAYFAENNLNIPFKSNQPSVTDFQTNLYGILPAVNEGFGWTSGVNKLYTTLAQDILYKDPMKLVIFLDNHDLSRFLTQVGENLDKMKVGLQWLLTCRGVPQMYYGTEVLMTGATHPNDGYVRKDFPGGWSGDTQNKFTPEGRTAAENEIHTLVTKLANFRLKSSAIKTGKFMQYVPQDGLYVYFRYDANQTIMCVMNTSDKPKEFTFSDYSERTQGFVKGTDVVSNKIFDAAVKHTVAPMQMLVLHLTK
ncbi:MAG: glycoside hydrolase family 13 protein [Chitinophagaceae bacterium]